MVLKPSEITPFCAIILAEIIDASGAPKGMFNLVNGMGPVVGAALSAHKDTDMMHFTGSTRAGVAVSSSICSYRQKSDSRVGWKVCQHYFR